MSDSTLTGNLASGNAGAGLLLDANADSNTIERTASLGNGQDGILVETGSADNVLEKNVASGNAVDGFKIDDATTTLTKNEAYTNAGDGIDPTGGAIDGGGNKARGNGGTQGAGIACG